jgi:Mg2+ and Co2+ transporter CorA
MVVASTISSFTYTERQLLAMVDSLQGELLAYHQAYESKEKELLECRELLADCRRQIEDMSRLLAQFVKEDEEP